MTTKVKKEGSEKPESQPVMFKCAVCLKDKPLQDMRSVTRFVPVMVVCRDCAKILR